MTHPSLTLHGYWRSGTSYRTRIALAIKGLDYNYAAVDLREGEQHEAAYRKLQPQGLVPALEADDVVLTQSPAIVEWIEERWPEPPLLPKGAHDRAIVRAMAAVIGCDIHPLNNLRVLKAIKGDFDADADQVKAWAARWIDDGFAALERQIGEYGGTFAFGDAPGLVECYLLPQVYSAERFETDLSAYPRLMGVTERAMKIDAIAAAHPDRQPDAD